MSDRRGRTTVADFLGDRSERLFHVGRLDYDTEGLMLLTNDGELAHRLAHPSFGVAKTYLAEVTGPVPKDLGRRLATGVELDDGVATADRFRVVDRSGNRALVEITLHEGRKHIVRRMLAEAGHPVSRLVRTDVGPIRLGNQRPGTTRDLTTEGNRRALRRGAACNLWPAMGGFMTVRAVRGAVQVDSATGTRYSRPRPSWSPR